MRKKLRSKINCYRQITSIMVSLRTIKPELALFPKLLKEERKLREAM
jgi:hypothetical protein